MSISEEKEDALYEAFLNSPSAGMFVPAKAGSPSLKPQSGGGWRECRIWEGYFDASLILLQTLLREKSHVDNLIYPALFNLRHAIEVALKWHIRYAGGTVPRRAGHDLKVLSEAFRRTASDLDDEATYISEYMLECISELASIDPHSVTFRYATQFEGSSIEINPNGWDLAQLCFTVGTMLVLFDGLSSKIDLSRDQMYQAYVRGD